MKSIKTSFSSLAFIAALVATLFTMAISTIAAAEEIPTARPVRKGERVEPTEPSQPVSTRRYSESESSRIMNVRVSPLGALIGYINFDFDFKVSEFWTVGPTFSYWSYNISDSLFQNDEIKLQSTRVGVRATWAKNGAFKSGLYVSPILQYAWASAEGTSRSTGNHIKAEAGAPIISGVVGYQWWFTESFNLNVGGGLTFGTQSTRVEVRDGNTTSTYESSRTAGVAIDAMIGYAF